MNATAKPFIIPSPLKIGDTIGLVAPAGPVRDRQVFNFGCKFLEDLGYQLKIPANIFSQQGYLAGADEERARQFTDIWFDPEVKMVLAARGGYGCLRLLPLLNLAELATAPKILAGFSDLTVLLNELSQQTGLITYHAPMLSTLARSDAESRTTFLQTLADGPLGPLRPNNLEIIRTGEGHGRLAGGNLTSLAHLIGTPHEINWPGTLLFLEDTGEPPYRIDRLLTHLERAGCLRQLAGLILGTFTDSQGEEEEWTASVWERALELAGDDYPIWGNFPVGHGARNFSLPIGMSAEMDSASGTLHFHP